MTGCPCCSLLQNDYDEFPHYSTIIRLKIVWLVNMVKSHLMVHPPKYPHLPGVAPNQKQALTPARSPFAGGGRTPSLPRSWKQEPELRLESWHSERGRSLILTAGSMFQIWMDAPLPTGLCKQNLQQPSVRLPCQLHVPKHVTLSIILIFWP